MANKEKLFTEFAAPTKQEWLDKIEVDLKGADFQKRLVWRTNEGFNVQPFYRREDLANLKTPDALPGEFPFVRGNKKDSNVWYVRQNIVVDDAKAANAKALDILNKGIDSLGFKLSGNQVSKETVEALLDNILCDIVEVNFATCPRHALELAEILVAYFDKKGYDKEKVVGSIEWDPMAKMVMKGKDVTPVLETAPKLVEALKDYPNFRCIAVSSDALNNAGSYIVQELGYALAWGNEYLQQLVVTCVATSLAASLAMPIMPSQRKAAQRPSSRCSLGPAVCSTGVRATRSSPRALRRSSSPLAASTSSPASIRAVLPSPCSTAPPSPPRWMLPAIRRSSAAPPRPRISSQAAMSTSRNPST